MKTITKYALIAAAVASVFGSSAFADNAQLQNQVAMQRGQLERNQNAPTLGVYAGRHGVSQRDEIQGARSGTRFELRTNARGQTFGAYVPVK